MAAEGICKGVFEITSSKRDCDSANDFISSPFKYGLQTEGKRSLDGPPQWCDSCDQLVQSVTWPLDIKTSLFKSDKWRPSFRVVASGEDNEREEAEDSLSSENDHKKC